MRTRRWCCDVMERRSGWVLALGLVGMVGFVGSLALVSLRWVGETDFLMASALALASYALSLLIGHLGDPFEFRRRCASDARREPTVIVVPVVAGPLKHAVGKRLVCRSERAPMRSVRGTVSHA